MRFSPAFLIAASMLAVTGCNSNGSGPDSANSNSPDGKSTGHLTKLKIEDTKIGQGDAVETGDEVWVNYTGTLMNGHVFDTNKKEGGKPFHVTVGAGQVIRGWDEGLPGLKVGGFRTLSVPANMAYGNKGQSGIPPNSDLIFKVECLDILKKRDANIINAKDISVGTGRQAKKGDTVTIDYVALADGEQFEDQKNVKFKIGADQIAIPGFDEAVVGMKVGGKREIKIPPALSRMMPMEKIGMVMSKWTVTLKAVN